MYLVLGISQLLVGILGAYAQTSAVMFLLCGVFTIWISRWFATTDLVHLGRDSLTVRYAPLRADRTFGYGEIDEIVEHSQKKATLRLNGGRTVALPMSSLRVEDRPRVVALIRKRRETSWE